MLKVQLPIFIFIFLLLDLFLQSDIFTFVVLFARDMHTYILSHTIIAASFLLSSSNVVLDSISKILTGTCFTNNWNHTDGGQRRNGQVYHGPKWKKLLVRCSWMLFQMVEWETFFPKADFAYDQIILFSLFYHFLSCAWYRISRHRNSRRFL